MDYKQFGGIKGSVDQFNLHDVIDVNDDDDSEDEVLSRYKPKNKVVSNISKKALGINLNNIK